MTIVIDYEQAKKNHMKADAERALKTFLNGEVGTSFILFPQALNPFLKTLESLGIWKQAVVFPAVLHEDGAKSKPAYMIVKTMAEDVAVSIETEKTN